MNEQNTFSKHEDLGICFLMNVIWNIKSLNFFSR